MDLIWCVSFETECIHCFLHSQKEKTTWFDKSQLHNLHVITKVKQMVGTKAPGLDVGCINQHKLA